jgi:hypothetical protein
MSQARLGNNYITAATLFPQYSKNIAITAVLAFKLYMYICPTRHNLNYYGVYRTLKKRASVKSRRKEKESKK